MLILKFIIYLLIFSSASSIGILISQKYKNREENLKELKNALNIFKTKIKFTYEPIPDIFKEISNTTKNSISNFFKLVCLNIQKDSASEAWNNAIEEENMSLSKEDKKLLKNLSKMLGKTDAQGQINQIDLTISFLDNQIIKAEKEREKNEKLYKSLGMITGVGLIIILL